MLKKSLTVIGTMAFLVLSTATLPRVAEAQDGDRAFTAWFVIFNNPAACTDAGPGRSCGAADRQNPAVGESLVFATGQRVPSSGRATFAASLGIGSRIGIKRGPGLLNPFGAEIHVALRTHGPIQADNMIQQLTTTGGCPDAGCRNLQAAFNGPGDADEEGRSTTSVVQLGTGMTIPDSWATLIRSEEGIMVVIDTNVNQ